MEDEGKGVGPSRESFLAPTREVVLALSTLYHTLCGGRWGKGSVHIEKCHNDIRSGFCVKKLCYLVSMTGGNLFKSTDKR